MEKEREGEMRRRGREGEGRRIGGGEMRKGILIGGMVLGLLMGCNNGGESADEKGLGEIIASSKQLFLDAFVTFGDLLLKDTFGIDASTTKKGIGEHLAKVGEAVGAVKDKLEGIKASEQYNLIKDKADNVIAKAIETLGKIVKGTSKIKDAAGNSADKVGGEVDDSQNANPADTESVKGLVEGISKICEAAREYGTDSKGNADKTIGR